MENWRLLVVEDEPDGQEVVSGLLGYYNIATDQVLTAEDALKSLNRNAYTAVIIDLNLPGMNGWELLRHIRENPQMRGLPCVAITAFYTSVVRQQALSYGFNAFFPKPLDDESFVQDLSAVIVNGG